MIDRPKFKEMSYDEYRFYDKNYPPAVDKHGYFDSVELKMDGIWGCMVVADGKYTIYSRTGKAKQVGDIEHDKDMNCNQCKWKLAPEYVRYKTQRGEPLCQMCYVALGGII